ncbi:hydroxyphenylacetyl-CoA thioesterase PaaI [Owenweeksia hongkongensis]|uniref:hydroxyphenylacetyl-CoA thioesterase PaaI n=1 Tax=Owenweeksia hongkongensis TaxID=253245 RepID=UPI003A95D632
MEGKAIVDKMYNGDAFSQWLGIERIEEKAGYSKLKMTVREEMTNGFKIAHGGITYSLADSALAFASNSHGRQAVSIETSISHTKPVHIGDVITAEAIELNLTNATGIYDIKVTNQNNEVVALFKGTVYRTKKEWTN